MGSRPTEIALAFALLALGALPARAAVDEDAPPPPPSDAHARPGAAIVYDLPPRPSDARSRACSFRTPVCVHYTDRPEAAAAVLASAERAWDVLTGALDLPAPDVDPDTLAYDVWLTADEDLATTHLAARDVRSRIDRARAFTTVTAKAKAGCALDASVTRAIARAILFRTSPATDEGVARAQVAYLTDLVVPCAAGLEVDAAQAFQAHPDRAVCDAHAFATPPLADAAPSRADMLFADGASLFWSRVDWAYARTPGGLVRATWALSPTMTDVGARSFRDEPDTFDVLRVTFKGALTTKSTLADLLLDTAVARAFLGAADDGVHQPETRRLGDAAKVAIDWDLPWPAQPKRVAPRAPVAPTGSSYLVIHRAGAPPGSRLRVEIAWEEHALFRWALVKLDAKGAELGRVVIPTPERATEAQMTLVDLDATDRVLLVGANAGDPAYAFDPDDAVWEPHGWLVTIASE